MKYRGAKYIHAFGVDNALMKPADPTFMEYCIQKNANCGNKVLWKTSPDKKVGVVATKGNMLCIVDYSEISVEMSTQSEGRMDN